jgi:hypothetical protein
MTTFDFRSFVVECLNNQYGYKLQDDSLAYLNDALNKLVVYFKQKDSVKKIITELIPTDGLKTNLYSYVFNNTNYDNPDIELVYLAEILNVHEPYDEEKPEEYYFVSLMMYVIFELIELSCTTLSFTTKNISLKALKKSIREDSEIVSLFDKAGIVCSEPKKTAKKPVKQEQLYAVYLDDSISLCGIANDINSLISIMNKIDSDSDYQSDQITIIRLKMGQFKVISRDFDQELEEEDILYHGSTEYFVENILTESLDLSRNYTDESDDE